MIGVKDYDGGPSAYWKEGYFYLRSAGGRIYRIYTPECHNIPAWAFDKPGAPKKPSHICPHCGKNNTTLVSGKYCNKCGRDIRE